MTPNVDQITLKHGSHQNPEAGLCAMEAVAFLAGEKHSDAPACACPVITRFVVKLNDRWNDEDRQLLKPYLVRIIDTRDPKKVVTRGFLAADWAVRQCAADWLEFAGLKESAERLRALEPITNKETAKVAERVSREERKKAAYAVAYAVAYAADAAAYAAAYAAYAADYAADAAAYAADAAAYAADAAYAAYAAYAAAADAAADATKKLPAFKEFVGQQRLSALGLLERMITA